MIELKNVSKYYKGENTVSLGMRRVSVNFNQGEFIAITGESGAGKSTLLNVISGLDGYEEGEMFFNGEPTSHYQVSDWELYRASNVGFIFQNYNIIDSYSVYQNVLLALEIQGYKNDKKKRAIELIEKVGLSHRVHHKASKLSGGEKQRCVIARALAKDCPIIVADEPTGNLDIESGKMVMKLLNEISKDKLVIVVTHNYPEVEPFVTRKIVMHDGEIVQDKTIKKPTDPVSKTNLNQKPKHMGFKSLLKFALRNIFATPKKTLFLLTLFMLVIGAITLMFAAAVSTINGISSGQSSFMTGLTTNRMEVTRRDNSAITNEDITYLNNLVGNENVSKYGEYLFNEYIQITDNSGGMNVYKSDYAKYISNNQIVTLDSKYDEIELESENIIYVSRDSNLSIGRSYFVSGFRDIINGYYSVTVAGIVETGSEKTIYFNDSFIKSRVEERGDSIGKTINLNPPYAEENTKWFYDWSYSYGLNVPKGTIYVNTSSSGLGADWDQKEVDFTFIDSYTNKSIVKKLKIVFDTEGIVSGYEAKINTADYDEIVSKLREFYLNDEGNIEYYYQVSVHLRNKQEGLNILDRYDKDTYRIYYPVNVPDTISEFLKFIATMGFILGISLLCVALFFVLSIATKNMMVSQKKDYAIYRSIGATEKSLSRLVVIEEALYGTIGFIITMILFLVLSLTVNEFYSMLIAINGLHILTIYLVVLIFSIRLGFKFNKKVFKYSVIETLTSEGVELI